MQCVGCDCEPGEYVGTPHGQCPLCLFIWEKYHAAARETSGCTLAVLHRIRLAFDALHVLVRESKMVTDLMHQHVGNDHAERFLMFGPIIKDRPPVEVNCVG